MQYAKERRHPMILQMQIRIRNIVVDYACIIQYDNIMIILYIRDHEGLGFSGQKYHPKTSLTNTFMAPWQYCLGISKPKNAFSMT